MLFERDNQGEPKLRSIPRPSTLRPPHYDARSVKAYEGVTRASGFVLNDFSRSKLDWAWTCDASLCLTDISEGFTAMTGRLCGPLLGAPLENLGQFEGASAPEMLAKLSAGEGLSNVPFTLETTDKPIKVLLSAIPIFSGDKVLIGLEGGIVRATEPVRETATFADNNTSRELHIAHQVQHELRTPLNAIAGFAQIMREDLKGRADGRYAGYCDDILSASQHLLGLIDDLVGAHDTQKTTLASPTVAPFNVATLFEEIRRLIEPMAARENRTLEIDAVDAALECTSDRRRVKQICLNLLENAVKFTPPGKALGLKVRQPASGALEILVWDEGPGIAEQDQALIWQRFQKAGDGTSYTSSSPGMGLGLSVVKSLADSIGAQIQLDSTLGEGSRFTVRLAQVS